MVPSALMAVLSRLGRTRGRVTLHNRRCRKTIKLVRSISVPPAATTVRRRHDARPSLQELKPRGAQTYSDGEPTGDAKRGMAPDPLRSPPRWLRPIGHRPANDDFRGDQCLWGKRRAPARGISVP